MVCSNVVIPKGATHQSMWNYTFVKVVGNKVFMYSGKDGWLLYANFFYKFPTGSFIELR